MTAVMATACRADGLATTELHRQLQLLALCAVGMQLRVDMDWVGSSP